MLPNILWEPKLPLVENQCFKSFLRMSLYSYLFGLSTYIQRWIYHRQVLYIVQLPFLSNHDRKHIVILRFFFLSLFTVNLVNCIKYTIQIFLPFVFMFSHWHYQTQSLIFSTEFCWHPLGSSRHTPATITIKRSSHHRPYILVGKICNKQVNRWINGMLLCSDIYHEENKAGQRDRRWMKDGTLIRVLVKACWRRWHSSSSCESLIMQKSGDGSSRNKSHEVAINLALMRKSSKVRISEVFHYLGCFSRLDLKG